MTDEVQIPKTIAEFPKKMRDNFIAWLKRRGAEIHATTDQEVLVVGTDNGVHRIYCNNDEFLIWTGELETYFRLHKIGGHTRLAPLTPRLRYRGKGRGSNKWRRHVKTMKERDGNECFFCGEPFTEEKRPTIEELVARTFGGPTHLTNQVLACEDCNVEAGNLSVAEKVRLRDQKRGFS